MSEKSDELHWRETYFILFPHDQRPNLEQVTAAISAANARFQLKNPAADDDGLFASLLVESPEDHAAVEISYEVGDAITEQTLEWAQQLQDQLAPEQIQDLIRADARLDIAHFERVQAGAPESTDAPSPFFGDEFDEDEDEGFEMLDPTCMLTVVDTLSQLTQGLAFDPASGEIVA
ncbi:MAG: hypothetical protein GXP26_05755 [Planctomycetes bacterium]|nr:hypothetical protein [Planctomycetota bacterium]